MILALLLVAVAALVVFHLVTREEYEDSARRQIQRETVTKQPCPGPSATYRRRKGTGRNQAIPRGGGPGALPYCSASFLSPLPAA